MNELDINILKSILSNVNHGVDFAHTYNNLLFSPNTQLFARFVIEYIKTYRALPTRRVLVSSHKQNESSVDYINSFMDVIEKSEYNTQEYPYDLEQLKKRYASESLLSAQQEPADKIAENPYKVAKKFATVIQKIQAVSRGRAFTQKTVKDHIDDFSNEYVAKTENESRSESILTRFSGIDLVTDGMAGSEMLIVGGETNAGKSIFLNNLGCKAWQQNNTIDMVDDFSPGANVLYFSLEMPYEECFARFMACLANVPQRSILGAALDSEERKRVEQAKRFIEAYPWEFDIVDFPRGLTIHEMEMRYNDALLTYSPDVIVVDYLQLMSDPARTKEADWLKLGGIAGDLHEFARTMNVRMFTAVQLTDYKRHNSGKGSKETAPEDDFKKRVGLHRFGRSSLMGQHANVAIQIDTRTNEQNFADMQYHVIKNRKGPLLQHASLKKNFENGMLIDIPYVVGDVVADNKPDISDKIINANIKNGEQNEQRP